MTTIGQEFPSDALKACANLSGAFPMMTSEDVKGSWTVYIVGGWTSPSCAPIGDGKRS